MLIGCSAKSSLIVVLNLPGEEKKFKNTLGLFNNIYVAKVIRLSNIKYKILIKPKNLHKNEIVRGTKIIYSKSDKREPLPIVSFRTKSHTEVVNPYFFRRTKPDEIHYFSNKNLIECIVTVNKTLINTNLPEYVGLPKYSREKLINTVTENINELPGLFDNYSNIPKAINTCVKPENNNDSLIDNTFELREAIKLINKRKEELGDNMVIHINDHGLLKILIEL